MWRRTQRSQSATCMQLQEELLYFSLLGRIYPCVSRAMATGSSETPPGFSQEQLEWLETQLPAYQAAIQLLRPPESVTTPQPQQGRGLPHYSQGLSHHPQGLSHHQHQAMRVST